MRTTIAFVLAIASAVALAPGCTCSWFAPSADVAHEAGPHKVTVKAQAHRKIGVDGFGAPHVGGVIWPAIDGYGFSVRIAVDNRPAVTIVAKSTPNLVTEAELSSVVGAVEIAGSPDGKHVAYKEPEKDWLVLHLLPVGTPFDSERSVVKDAKVDWATLPAPEDIALEALRDAKRHHGTHHVLLWDAVLAQPSGPPWDDGLLEAFPSSKRAQEWATERFEREPAPSAAWRESAAKRAVSALVDKSFNKDEMSTFVTIIVKADLPSERDAMDKALVEVWQDHDEYVRSGKAFRLLGGRLDVCPEKPWSKRIGPPPSDEARRAMVAAARALFDRKHDDRDEALEIILAAGSDADRAWVDDMLVAAWPEDTPEGSGPYAQTDVHDQLVARAAGKPSSRCQQSRPPPGPEWRARARDKARPLLSHQRDGHKAASVLVALGDQPELDAGLDYWLERFPDDLFGGLSLRENAARGSPSWKARAIAKAESIRADAEAKLAPGYDVDQAGRRGAASSLLYRLEYETADCERLADFVRTKQQYDEPPPMPERCVKK